MHLTPCLRTHLRPGVQVINVNGHNLINEDHTRAVKLIQAGGDDLTLVLAKPERTPSASTHPNQSEGCVRCQSCPG